MQIFHAPYSDKKQYSPTTKEIIFLENKKQTHKWTENARTHGQKTHTQMDRKHTHTWTENKHTWTENTHTNGQKTLTQIDRKPAHTNGQKTHKISYKKDTRIRDR